MVLNLLLVPAGALLWFLGGRGADLDYDPTVPKLHKKWRRIVWPIVAGVVAVLNGVPMLTALLMSASMGITLSLGYGESKSWPYRLGVAAALGLPFVLLQRSYLFPLTTLLTFVPMYYLSLKRNWMSWPVVEATIGATQGAILAYILK